MESDIIEASEITNILKNIDNYNDELLISHVIIFFKRHNIEFTKTMIQNYVKMGLLPPTSENRRYTKDHLLLLAMINGLKETYSLEEIKALLDILNEYLEPVELYRLFIRLHTDTIKEFSEIWRSGIENRQALIDRSNLKSMDKNKADALISLMTLPTCSKIIKNIIKALWDTI